MRTSAVQRALRSGLLALGLASGCGDPYDTVTVKPLDCTVEDAYEFLSIDDFEKDVPFWTATDVSSELLDPETDPRAAQMALTQDEIEGGGRCGSNFAMVVRASHNNDWGSLAGYNNFGRHDASEYEGLSFWARAPRTTTKVFTVLLDDTNTFATQAKDGQDKQRCVVYGGTSNSGGNGSTSTSASAQVDNSGNSGRASFPDECGNSYAATVVVSDQWELYTIPFSKFTQTAQPNRVPNAVFTETGGIPGTGIIPGSLWNLGLRMPKEAQMELWLDNLGFYRKKRQGD